MAADPTQLKKTKELGRPDVLFSLARMPDSGRVIVGSSDFKVYDVDLAAEKPEPVEMAGHSSYVMGVALAGATAISGGWDGRLIWWNTDTHEQVRAIDAHDRWIRGVTTSPDGKTLVSVADDMVCRVWDAASGKKLHELRGHEAKTPNHYPSMLYAVTISPDGNLLATGDKVGHVVVWDLASGKSLATLEAPVMYTWDPNQRRHSIGGIRSLAFSSDGKQLAVGGMGKVGNIDHLGGKARVEVFDWQKGEQTHEFPGDKFKGLVEHLVFQPEGNWLLAAGGDNGGFLTFFDLEKKSVLHEEKAPMHIHSLALNEASDTIYAAGHKKLVIWEFKNEATTTSEEKAKS